MSGLDDGDEECGSADVRESNGGENIGSDDVSGRRDGGSDGGGKRCGGEGALPCNRPSDVHGDLPSLCAATRAQSCMIVFAQMCMPCGAVGREAQHAAFDVVAAEPATCRQP